MKSYDILGIGFGPANIALAISLEEASFDGSIHFMEKRSNAAWLPNFLLKGSDIQNNPIRDLVTPTNPRSKYSYINYLFENNRLIEVLNLNMEFPLRKEYSNYIHWAAQHFTHLTSYSSEVVDIKFAPKNQGYIVTDQHGKQYQAKHLVIATGRTPYIPKPFNLHKSKKIFHFTSYSSSLEKLQQEKLEKVAVIGASQSAVELTIDLAQRLPKTKIHNYIRNFGFRLKDTSPFMEETITPEFTDYYYQLTNEAKKELDLDTRYTNYSASDLDVLKELYHLMYEQRLDNEVTIELKRHRLISDVIEEEEHISIVSKEKYTNEMFQDNYDAVILATGFKNLGEKEEDERYPNMLKNLLPYCQFNTQGVLQINKDYSVKTKNNDIPKIFLLNLCESSHGIADAGSMSLISLRANTVMQSIYKNL